jgi:hypothetical protein
MTDPLALNHMQGGCKGVFGFKSQLDYALDVAEDNPSQEDLSGFSKSFYLLLIN